MIDYDREMALVAVKQERTVDEEGEVQVTERLLGVSRYVTNPDRTTCEFALVVADDMAGQGLGARLMLSIMEVARDKGLEHIEGLVLTNNPNMLNSCAAWILRFAASRKTRNFAWWCTSCRPRQHPQADGSWRWSSF